ncbi:unnamed protein product [Meloidogyne enterolobii]|uniref:Uncharacterized protein n=1 Tax=Meloidogyne enterolobii TaxID=390850 RepID=A0ACB1A4U0_MELEN
MAGSFAVFEALGIKNTFDVSSNVFYPMYLQFLDFGGKPLDVTKVPGQNNKNKCLRKYQI